MKKNLFRILLITLLFITCGMIEAVNYNRKEFNLKGDVYCIGIKEYSFNIEFGELKRGSL